MERIATMDVPALANSLCAQAFARNVLGFIPDELQAQVLDCYADRVILNCTRQWGKSTVCAAKAVHLAYCEPGSLILVASPSARQSSEFVRKAALFLRKLAIKPRGDGDNDISLALPNGSRIVGIPGIEATVRGFSSVSLMLVDEASRVPDELYRALRPMLAVGGGSLWLLSTPYGKRGFFYNEWANGENSWTRFRIPATDCPRIAASFLEQERRALGPRYFAQEYMCEFHATNDALFNEAQVRRAITGDSEDESYPNVLSREFFVGVDLGQRRDRTAIVVLERAVAASNHRSPLTFAPDHRTTITVRNLQRFPLDTPYTVIVESIHRLAQKLAASARCAVIVDATGVGLPIVDALRAPAARWSLMPVIISHADREAHADGFWRVPKRDLMARLQIAFDFEELAISGHLEERETLVEELTAMRATIRSSGRTRYESPGDLHDDLALALSLAWWGVDTHRHGQVGESKRLL